MPFRHGCDNTMRYKPAEDTGAIHICVQEWVQKVTLTVNYSDTSIRMLAIGRTANTSPSSTASLNIARYGSFKTINMDVTACQTNWTMVSDECPKHSKERIRKPSYNIKCLMNTSSHSILLLSSPPHPPVGTLTSIGRDEVYKN